MISVMAFLSKIIRAYRHKIILAYEKSRDATKKYVRGVATGVVTAGVVYTGFAWFDYKLIVQPLRDLEKATFSLKEVVKSLEKMSSSYQFIGCVDRLARFFLTPIGFSSRDAYLAYVWAETYRNFNEYEKAVTHYKKCLRLLPSEPPGYLTRIFFGMVLDDRSCSDMLLMRWKCTTHMLAIKLLQTKDAVIFQHFVDYQSETLTEVQAELSEAPVGETRKQYFLASLNSTYAQYRSRPNNDTDSEKYMREAYVLINTAMEILFSGDIYCVASCPDINNIKKQYGLQTNQQLIVSAHTWAKKSSTVTGGDAVATVLYNWLVITKNSKIVPNDIKQEARNLLSNAVRHPHVRPNTARNCLVQILTLSNMAELLSDVMTGKYKSHVDIVEGIPQEKEFIMPYAVALALHGRFKEALAIFAYLDHEHNIDENICDRIQSSPSIYTDNRNTEYTLCAFLLASLGQKDKAIQLLNSNKAKCDDHELLRRAFTASTILQDSELSNKLTEQARGCCKPEYPTATDGWWLVCCLLLLDAVNKEDIDKLDTVRAKLGVDVTTHPWSVLKNNYLK